MELVLTLQTSTTCAFKVIQVCGIQETQCIPSAAIINSLGENSGKKDTGLNVCYNCKKYVAYNSTDDPQSNSHNDFELLLGYRSLSLLAIKSNSTSNPLLLGRLLSPSGPKELGGRNQHKRLVPVTVGFFTFQLRKLISLFQHEAKIS